ncbi:uncharacterized protein RJT21DRAFT_132105 [Scheffersomyces amazonensis]|uniref:uncharacterized protein n=1 Tax=Scheffersomyces amazonensis TaxID=1078765 RepID=UPI00315D4301
MIVLNLNALDEKRNKVKFQITGDDIDTDSAIILSNHVSLADHFVIAYLARNSCTTTTDSSKLENSIVLPRVNFFSWFLVWRVPTWKVLFNMAKCDENWELDESLLDSVFYKVLHSRTPEWLIMFPEVNIFTHENALIQQQQSSKYCLPLLENVLYPRFSGIFNLVSAIQKSNNFKFTKIYDINLLYSRESNNPKNIFITPTLFDIFTSSSPPITVHIFVKTRFLSRLPQKRSKVERYIEHAWVDKDKQLTEQKKRLINDYQISTSNYHIDLETTALNSSY